jgi:hypothetical protein
MRQQKNQERLIAALLESESISLAAEKAGMSRQHVHKLLKDRDFTKALREARSQAHAHAMTRLCQLSSKAVSVLETALCGDDVSKTKFLSARTILELAGRAIETDIEDRLAAIEAELERTANATYTT